MINMITVLLNPMDKIGYNKPNLLIAWNCSGISCNACTLRNKFESMRKRVEIEWRLKRNT